MEGSRLGEIKWPAPFKRSAAMVRRNVALLYLRSRGVDVVGTTRLYGLPYIRRFPGSSIKLGNGVVLSSSMGKNSLEVRGPVVIRTIKPAALVAIGDDSGFSGSTVSCAYSISIGSRVLVGSGVLITDSDHHAVDVGVDGVGRRTSGLPTSTASDAVIIHDDVFIGARTIILKGVTVGKGSVIGAGSVVSSDIPAGVIAAGNPCRTVRPLRTNSR